MRPYRQDDSRWLERIGPELFPDARPDGGTFGRQVDAGLAAGGRAGVIEAHGAPAGYAWVAPVPGLDGIFELHGGIRPGQQRRGLGGRLLDGILRDAERLPAVRQIAHPVTSLDSPAARFLVGHGFYLEHEEWQLALEPLPDGPPPPLPEGYTLQELPRPAAIAAFRSLYDAAFGGTAWYQPYLSDGEVSADLWRAADLLFLSHAGRPVGVAWIRGPQAGRTEIEPFGLAAGYQGRGLGRLFLSAALARLVERGARRVELGLWRDNEAALRLYRSFGFRHTGTVSYLARDL